VINVSRFSSGEPLPSLSMLRDAILAAIVTVLAVEICVCWKMLICVDILVSCIWCKFCVAGRLVVVIGSSR